MHRFDKDIEVTPGDGGDYAAVITPNWSINKVPNGGYLMAIVANAMLQSSQGMVAWVPTLEYSVSFRNQPATEDGREQKIRR